MGRYYYPNASNALETEEQQLRIVGRLLVEMNEEGLIGKEGLRWLVR